jgi:hypothetical protein
MTSDLDFPVSFLWPSKAVPKNEKSLRHRFIKKFKEEHPGAWIYCPRDMLRSGVPDLLAVFQGHAFAFELKMQGNKPTPMQIATLADLDAAGACVRLVVQMKDGVVRSMKYGEFADNYK